MVAGAGTAAQSVAASPEQTMLFFFELFLFILVLLTLALGEFVSRGLALTLWLVVTAFALAGYPLARASLRDLTSGHPASTGESQRAEPRLEGSVPPEGSVPAPTPIDERWARTLLYNWRRSNVLLVLGAMAVGAWYWLGTR